MLGFARPDREYQALRESIDDAVRRVLGSGRLILGEEVVAFEHAFARAMGARFAVGVSNGTDALVTALHALEVGEGDEVIVAAFGFVAAPEAVVRVGATPVFADVEPLSLGLSPSAVRAAVSERTRAIVSVDLFGIAHDTSALRAPGIAIVEDAAQALGTTRDGRRAGTLGEIGTFSFFPSKALGAAGDGGACVTDDEQLAARMARIRLHGGTNAYNWDRRGGNYRLDALQAAVLSAKLTVLPARLARRRAIGEELAAVARRGGASPICAPTCEPIYAPLALRIEGRRDQVLARLRADGVDARVHYPVALSTCRPFSHYPRRPRDAEFPEAERATGELLSVPFHPELTDDEVSDLLEKLGLALR